MTCVDEKGGGIPDEDLEDSMDDSLLYSHTTKTVRCGSALQQHILVPRARSSGILVIDKVGREGPSM